MSLVGNMNVGVLWVYPILLATNTFQHAIGASTELNRVLHANFSTDFIAKGVATTIADDVNQQNVTALLWF
jgi:hypothetical protein